MTSYISWKITTLHVLQKGAVSHNVSFYADNYFELLPIVSSAFKGTRCHGSVKFVFEKHLQPFVIKCI